MRYLIIGDQHFGMGNNNTRLLNQSRDFYENLVIPLIKDKSIDAIIDLGDTFDKRDIVNINVLNEVKDFAYNKINIPIYIIVGNHSLFYRNSDKLNNLLVLNEYSNIHIIDKFTQLENIDLVPWISNENVISITDSIINSKSKYCFGHFEFNGFKYDKTRISEVKEKITQNIFKKYNKVFSGHYHIQSEQNNILYTGSPYQLTWIDCDVDKNIFILDTNENTIKEIKNDNKLFIKVNFNEADSLNKDDVYKKYVKVIYDNNILKEQINILTDKLNSFEPEDLTFISTKSEISKNVLLDSNNKEEVDLMHTISNYTKLIYNDDNLLKILEKSYNESLNGDN